MRRLVRLFFVISILTTVFVVVAPSAQASSCALYQKLEAGKGPAKEQHWFNYLDARGYARYRMACVHSWGTNEWECLDQLWKEESNWNHLADGHGSTWGIPQAYPGNKMASHGKDWKTNPRVQVRWGLDYIRDRYGRPTRASLKGTPCHAGY